MARSLLATLLLSVAAFPALAQSGLPVAQAPTAGPVYQGCVTPGPFTGATWRVDAINGNDTTGNGSQTAPYASIAKGITVAKPGDQILVNTGNYGDLHIGSFGHAPVNSSFITIEAAPGQTPVLTSIIVDGGAEWIVRGFKVQSPASAGWWSLLYVVAQGAGALSAHDIIIDSNDISSADDSVAATWTLAQWESMPRAAALLRGDPNPNATCISLTNNRFHNVATGVAILSNNTLVAYNQIDHFTADAPDYAGSNLQINGNCIHDVVTTPNSPHQDAMQGQIGDLPAGVAFNTFSNVLIDGNLIVRLTDPNMLKFAGVLQGIDNFDEAWVNWQVTNNVVVTSSSWGISSGSATDSIIAGNTVLADGWQQPGLTYGAPTVAIGAATNKGGASANDVIENNIANAISLYAGANMVMQHNVAQKFTYPADIYGLGGAAMLAAQGGSLATNLWATAAQWFGLFVSWNPPATTTWAPFTFNLNLAPKSAALYFGAFTGVPPNAGAL